jgi:hypothetical protein
MEALFTAKFEGANTAFRAYAVSFALCLTFFKVSNRQNHEDLLFPPFPITSEYQQRFSTHCMASAGNILKQKLEVFDYNYM